MSNKAFGIVVAVVAALAVAMFAGLYMLGSAGQTINTGFDRGYAPLPQDTDAGYADYAGDDYSYSTSDEIDVYDYADVDADTQFIVEDVVLYDDNSLATDTDTLEYEYMDIDPAEFSDGAGFDTESVVAPQPSQ